jgi:uncharacterized protein
MSRAYYDIAFTPAVRAVQTRMGSRSTYAPLDHTEDRRDALTADEAEFIRGRDGFYQASVSESGWPYVQFRGGPAGFLKVLDGRTIGYADFRGNVQYVSAGNATGNDRASMFVMDYAHRQRLKLLGRLHFVDVADADPELLRQVALPDFRARFERVAIFDVVAFDWNCPQHITQRFTLEEVEAAAQPLRARIADLEAKLLAVRTQTHTEEP